MALITCPECGRKASDRAKTCPDCGYPIAAANPSGPVSIKICNGLLGKVRIYDMATFKLLWEGKAGQIAVFDVIDETEVGICWGIGKPEKCDRKARVRGNERYSLNWTQGFLTTDMTLNRVDVIDSE